MKSMLQFVLLVLLLFAQASAPARAQDGILNVIPADSLGFAVVHDLADVSRSLDDVATLVQAPAPNVLAMAKAMTGLQRGLDEQGDAALVVVGTAAESHLIVLAPVANFADVFAALNVAEPATGSVVEVQLAGQPMLVGRKASYAAFAPATDREALEQFLADTTNLTSDAALAEWLAANQASLVITSRGIKELLPQLTAGIRAVQAQLRAVQTANGPSAADGLNLYIDLFTAAQTEVEQFGFGVRIDSAQTVSLVKRARFTPAGTWAQWAAAAQPAEEDFLAGLPAGPFMMAGGGVIPAGAIDRLMEFSVSIMQNQPGFQLTPEQAEKYVKLSTAMTQGLRSMRMVLGVAEPGTGLYGNSSAVMIVEDSQRYLEEYEKSLAAMRELAQEAQSPLIPIPTSRRVAVGDTEAIEVTMDMQNLGKLSAPGGPDMSQTMQTMFGASGSLTTYVAPADAHTIVMAYTSLEKLQAALEFFKSKQPGLSGDAGVAKVAAALPAGSQFVMYVSLNGFTQLIRQSLAAAPGGQQMRIPEIPESPPLGIAAKLTPEGLEGRLAIAADSLRAIGEVVAKNRGTAAEAPSQ